MYTEVLPFIVIYGQSTKLQARAGNISLNLPSQRWNILLELI